MDDGVTKKIVVIKNLQSNLIEEAILILKNNPGQKDSMTGREKSGRRPPVDNNFLLKEARMIVNDYIRQNTIQQIPRKEQKRMPLISNKKFLTNTIINTALIGSIAIFIFAVSKLF